MSIFAGYKSILLAVAVLGVIGIGYTTIQWLQNTGRQELQIEKLQENLEIQERIDNAVRNTPTGRDAAIGVLNDFITRD